MQHVKFDTAWRQPFSPLLPLHSCASSASALQESCSSVVYCIRTTINAFSLTRYDAAALSRHIGIGHTVKPICQYVGGRGLRRLPYSKQWNDWERSRDSRKKLTILEITNCTTTDAILNMLGQCCQSDNCLIFTNMCDGPPPLAAATSFADGTQHATMSVVKTLLKCSANTGIGTSTDSDFQCLKLLCQVHHFRYRYQS